MSLRQFSTRLLHSRRYFCDKLWAACSIRWNGDLEPCPCACGNTPVFSIPGIPFLDAWNSTPYQTSRAYLLRQLGRTDLGEAAADQVFDICRNCSVPLVDRHSIIRWRLKGMGLSLRRQMLTATSSEARNVFEYKVNNYNDLLSYLRYPQTTVPHYPILGNIDASNICNLRCPMCKVGTREINHPRGMMSYDLFARILEEIGRGLIRLELYRYGEPMLNPEIVEMTRLASQKYQIRTTISTNFSMPLPAKTIKDLVRSGLDTLVVAADGTDQSMYEKYRQGGNFAQVIDNLKAIVSARRRAASRTPKIIWQYLIFSHNENTVAEARELALRLGVDRFVAIEPAIPRHDTFANWISRKQGYRGSKDEIVHQQVLEAAISPQGPIRRNTRFEIAVRIRNTTDEAWPKDNVPSTPHVALPHSAMDENEGSLSPLLAGQPNRTPIAQPIFEVAVHGTSAAPGDDENGSPVVHAPTGAPSYPDGKRNRPPVAPPIFVGAPIRLGIKLYRSDEFLHELGRGMLENNLGPGEEQILHIKLAAPEIPGNYRLKLDMLRENEYWFEWKTGHRSKPLWIDLPII